MLVVQHGCRTATLAHATTIHAIQQAMVNALNWNQALLDGQAQSMTELAIHKTELPKSRLEKSEDFSGLVRIVVRFAA